MLRELQHVHTAEAMSDVTSDTRPQTGVKASIAATSTPSRHTRSDDVQAEATQKSTCRTLSKKMYMPHAVVWEPNRLPCVAEALYRTMVVAAQAAKSSHRAATAAMIGRSQVVVPLAPAAVAALSLAIHSIVAVT